jgi:hypothetical protein
MGMRMRLHNWFDCSAFTAPARVMCTALKTYGMILADNGGDWFISGSPHPLFTDAAAQVTGIAASNFDVVDTGASLCTSDSCS